MTTRDLDRAVAERVMGYVVTQQSDGVWMAQEHGQFVAYVDDSHNFPKWSPTTNHAHWMQVVERMREKDFEFVIGNGEQRLIRAGFWKPGEATGRCIFEHEQIGVAICRAALAALGGR